jgi:hypothetical protein
MPMKPTSPESLKGVAGFDRPQARLLDDEEVEQITGDREKASNEDDEDGEEDDE